MIRETLKYKRIDNLTVEITLPNITNCFVKAGDRVKKGDRLYSAVSAAIIESHFLPQIFGIKPQESASHIGRLEGQYVVPGDLLGERLMAGGLLTKKIVAGNEGVISLARINEGYLDILSESQDIVYESKVNGRVLEVNAHKNILIECEGWGIDYHSATRLEKLTNEQGAVVGELTLIEDGKSLYTKKSLADEYEDKIVFAGRWIEPDIARELYKRDCKAIIVYSIDYEVFRELNIPIVVLGGFGKLSAEMDFYDELLAVEGQSIQIDPKSNLIIIHQRVAKREDSKEDKKEKVSKANGKTDEKSELFEEEFAHNPALRTTLNRYLSQIKKGDYIRSYELESYGQIGKVEELSVETDTIIALRKDRSKLIASAENVEVISDIMTKSIH